MKISSIFAVNATSNTKKQSISNISKSPISFAGASYRDTDPSDYTAARALRSVVSQYYGQDEQTLYNNLNLSRIRVLQERILTCLNNIYSRVLVPNDEVFKANRLYDTLDRVYEKKKAEAKRLKLD